MIENEHHLFKNRFRFSENLDLQLLREVYGQNPYEDPKRWSLIQTNMIQITGTALSPRTLRERVQNLVKKYLAKAKLYEGKSGIETEVTELDDLLQQISELMLEFQNKKSVAGNIQPSTKNITEKSSYQKGYELREKASASFREPVDGCSNVALEIEVTNIENNRTSDITDQVQIESNVTTERKRIAQPNILTPKRKRTSSRSMKQCTIQYLSKKNEKNHELRCRELALKEKQLLFDEKKHELECYERRKRLEIEERRVEMEEKRMKIQEDSFLNQQDLMKAFIKSHHR